MKKFVFLVSLGLAVMACQTKNDPVKQRISADYAVYGDTLSGLDAKPLEQLYGGLEQGDTLSTLSRGVVTAVCKKKGCWMTLAMEGDKEVMVRFKDYGFFVPKDIEGKEVLLQGDAFVDILSVADQRHYAEDGGETADQIAAITEPKETYTFIASGVLIKK